MTPRQRRNATRATTTAPDQTAKNLSCSTATQPPPHTGSAETSRSYVTHLIEDGWDPRFVQEQVGHEHASTTSIYTCVSADFRTRTLRRALDQTIAAAVAPPGGAHR